MLLVGDSITQGWGGGWDRARRSTPRGRSTSADQKTVNLGIGGDRIESILWRLDHGALDGASPKVIVLMIGVNNAPLVFANGVPAASAAHGIKLCIENLRLRCPQSQTAAHVLGQPGRGVEIISTVAGRLRATLVAVDLGHDLVLFRVPPREGGYPYLQACGHAAGAGQRRFPVRIAGLPTRRPATWPDRARGLTFEHQSHFVEFAQVAALVQEGTSGRPG